MFKLLSSGIIATIFSLFISAPASANDTGIASILHTLRGEKGMVCMVGHFHHGKSPRPFASRAKAMKTAVRHWASFTAMEYGSDWASFGSAANRASECDKISKSKWACKVKARPCRRGLSVARR